MNLTPETVLAIVGIVNTIFGAIGFVLFLWFKTKFVPIENWHEHLRETDAWKAARDADFVAVKTDVALIKQASGTELEHIRDTLDRISAQIETSLRDHSTRLAAVENKIAAAGG